MPHHTRRLKHTGERCAGASPWWRCILAEGARTFVSRGHPRELAAHAALLGKDAHEDVSISVLEAALTIHRTHGPLSRVPAAIGIEAGASAVALIVLETALVALSAALERVRRQVELTVRILGRHGFC